MKATLILALFFISESFAQSSTTPKPNICATNNGGCDPNANCVQLGGLRTCTCKIGFIGVGTTCSAIKRAQNSTTRKPNAHSSTTRKPKAQSSTTTTAPKPKAQNQTQSQPQNQTQNQNLCATNNGGCDPNANCVQLGGLRTCMCKIGFVGTGMACSDITTCSKNNGGCHTNANCVNILGSVQCNCKIGFTGDGKTSCTPKPGSG